MKNQAALRILVLAAIPTAAAQTYTFSACNGVGVPGNALFTDQKGTFIYTITQVISGGAVPGASGYSYTAMANYTAVSSLGAAKNFTNVPSAVTIGFLPVGPQGRTSFRIAPASPAGSAVPPDGRWEVQLTGDGNLLPNGLPSSLPPISSWTTAATGNLGDVVVVTSAAADGGQVQYLIDTLGPCSGSSGANAKALGGLTTGCVLCGDPINVGTGNLYESVADYQTATPNKLEFRRFYNSMSASSNLAAALGANWRSNYDRYVQIVSPSSVIAERADGRQLTFTLSGGAWKTDTDVDVVLTNSGTTWTLTDTDDTVETYKTVSATEALLQTVRAGNGYTQTLAYNGSNQLTGVTDSYQRQLSFTYSSGLLQTVTTPDGLLLTYGYAAGGSGRNLTSVGYSTSPVTGQTYLYENAAFANALTGIIDENGNRYATWTYDSTGRALTSQHADGADLIQVTYNDNDGSRTVTGPLGIQSVYKFTTLQGVPKVSEIDRSASATTAAGTQKTTYDSNGYVASQTDWNGNLTTYVNDVHGQPMTVVEAMGTAQARTTTVSYHATFHLPVKIVQAGLTTTFTYDANGERLSKVVADTTTATAPYATGGQTRTWTYTWSNSLPASMKTPRTDVNGLTTYTYDSGGALTTITNALGQTTKITQHLPGGLPQTIVDPNGVGTNLTYDARQRLLSRTVNTAAGALTTTYTYDAAGNLLSTTQPDGSTLTNTYDAAHRLTARTDILNQVTGYTLDAQGDRTQTNLIDVNGVVQGTRSAVFDALGSLHQSIGGAGQTSSFAYDANGNPISITDPLTRVTAQAFDALNRRVKTTDPARGVATSTYDALDRLTGFTDPNGGTTNYVYDGFGDMIQQASPDTGTTVHRYDSNGNLTQSVDATGATANYTYDALDRMSTVTYPADSAENVKYTYDQAGSGFGIGRLTGVTDAAGTLKRSYDERGNLLSETRVTAGMTLVTSYTYDAASRPASITYPSGWVVAYTRDAMGQPTAVTAQSPDGSISAPVVAGVGYQPFGPVNGTTFGNGVVETRSFDPDYRLTNLTDAGNSPVQNLTYVYDPADNVLSTADGVTAANSQNFGYDALDRLTAAGGAYGNLGYTYDSVGNRLTESLGGSPMAVSSYAAKSNQLASLTAGGATGAIGYSKAGNITVFASPSAGAITGAGYNQAGRLAAVMTGGGIAARYTYDAFGHRLMKQGAVSGTTLYTYDGSGHLLEETDDQGNALVDYIYLGALPVATISPATAQIYFLHGDRIGTPQAGTDANQNSVWTASYGPFGEMSTVPGLIVQNLRLPGQEFDIDSGFYHNGFRDYSPAWGRYIESDPVGLAGGMNTYGYALANPVKVTDPLGLLAAQDFVATVRSIGQSVESGLNYLEGQAGSALNNLITQLFELKYNGQEGYLLTHCPTKDLPILEALLGAKSIKDVWDELRDLSESELKRWGWALTIGGEVEKQWENETNQQIQQQNRPNGGLYLPPPNPPPNAKSSPTHWAH